MTAHNDHDIQLLHDGIDNTVEQLLQYIKTNTNDYVYGHIAVKIDDVVRLCVIYGLELGLLGVRLPIIDD